MEVDEYNSDMGLRLWKGLCGMQTNVVVKLLEPGTRLSFSPFDAIFASSPRNLDLNRKQVLHCVRCHVPLLSWPDMFIYTKHYEGIKQGSKGAQKFF